MMREVRWLWYLMDIRVEVGLAFDVGVGYEDIVGY